METSIIVARVLGVVYLALALGVLFDWARYKEVIVEIIDSSGYLVLAGFLAIVLGVLILSLQPGVSKDWTIAIPIVGWISVFKGVFLVSFPKSMVVYKSFLDWSNARWVILIITLVVGILFSYFGFIY